MKRYIVVTLFFLLSLFLVSSFAHASSAPAPSPASLAGWAWSSNIGWVSFDSTTSGSSEAYGVTVDPSTGNLDGDAWSSTIGWISFDNAKNTASGLCPGASSEADCQPEIVLSNNQATGQVTGWARALTAAASSDAGDWDGWIELSGTNHLYNANGTGGVSYAASGGNDFLTGFAWGGPVIGWLNFYPDNPNTCSGSGCPTPPPPPPCGNGGCPGGPLYCAGSCPPFGGSALYSLIVNNVGVDGGAGVVTSLPTGIDCVTGSPTDCAADFSSGAVDLTADITTPDTTVTWGNCTTVTSGNVCKVSLTSNQIITATFTGSGAAPTVSCGPSAGLIQVNHVVNWAAGSQMYTSYSWKFDGGSPSTSLASSPTVSYANPGTYSASLAVNGGLSQQCGSQVTVQKNPVFIEF